MSKPDPSVNGHWVRELVDAHAERDRARGTAVTLEDRLTNVQHGLDQALAAIARIKTLCGQWENLAHLDPTSQLEACARALRAAIEPP